MNLIQSTRIRINNNKQYAAFATFSKNTDCYVSTIEVCFNLNNDEPAMPSKLLTTIELKIYNPISKKQGKLIEEQVAVAVLSILTKRSN